MVCGRQGIVFFGFDLFQIFQQKEQSRPTLMPNPPLRPMRKKDSVKEGAVGDEFDYQCVDISPTLENIPAYEWADVISQPPMCETDSVPPNVETITNANEAMNWKNIHCRTTPTHQIFVALIQTFIC